MISEEQFPVSEGAAVSLRCKDGYWMQGDDVVTCQYGNQFFFREEPSCHLEGKNQVN